MNQLHTGKKIILSLKTERINTLSYLCISLISLNFRLPYVSIFGGVSAMTKDQILFVNGFSNQFSGWGGEDDDMFNRCQSNQSQAISFFFITLHSNNMFHLKDTITNVGTCSNFCYRRLSAAKFLSLCLT